ncbi:glycoside hydrolase family 88 protein [Parabacteroides sp. FAFU027]|uniref:glycoside hydrolase family 88 protein n=1 Tax=Parabacteroides sp. FAFU027 TaxID=2922715 RepID=UPI00397925B1
MKNRNLFWVMIASVALVSCSVAKKFDVNESLKYCDRQVERSLKELTVDTLLPRNIADTAKNWKLVDYKDWTSGFWPGILWYDYEFTKDEKVKEKAIKYTELLKPLSENPAYDHDLGFQVFCSYGNAYRLTKNEDYRKLIVRTADTLATLFNPRVGTILSWPRMIKDKGWPHNTIMDNMINLELLFWASKHGGGQNLYDIAVKHAETTMKNHFRPDYTSYHVVLYDTITGKKIKGMTHQGYSDSSMWARGQAWAIYGFTMCYRETKKQEFLDFAQKVTEPYISRLPNDYIPYWDFNAPDIPKAAKDASAAAVVASALLELSGYVKEQQQAKRYKYFAMKMIVSLSSDKYLSGNLKPSFLLHSTGHWPNKSEIDYSINYADYYYIEALTRLKKLEEGRNILE